MYRTHSALASLLPLLPGVAPERFAVWLAKGYVQNTVAKAPLAALSARRYSAAPPPPPVAAEPFLNGSSSAYVEEMYNAWLQDPKSVHAVRKNERTIRSQSKLADYSVMNLLAIYKCQPKLV